MQLKHILCTLFALGIVGAAHAADDIITGGDGTCNETVLGTSENLATANTIATWSLNEYDCPAGQYLLVDGDNIACTPCASGSYCPGGIFTVESENKGTNICPTDYASSATGSDSQSDCYTGCSATCKQQPVPTHAINVTHGNETSNGKLYYGGSCDANTPICSMTFQCATGYHKRPDLTEDQMLEIYAGIAGINIENLPPEELEAAKENLVPLFTDQWEMAEADMADDPEYKYIVSMIDKIQHPDNQSEMPIQPYINIVDEFKQIPNPSMGNTTMFVGAGYAYEKDLNGTESCYVFDSIGYGYFVLGPIANEADCDSVSQQNSDLAEFRQIAQNGDWFITIPERDIIMSGISRCEGPRETGLFMPEYSYMNIQGVDMPESWSNSNDIPDTLEICEKGAASMGAGSGFGQLLFIIFAEEDLDVSLAEAYPELYTNSNAYITYVCDANKIGIDWNPDDGSENIAGMCLYGGDVNIPEYVPTKPGYTFKGWKLVTE